MVCSKLLLSFGNGYFPELLEILHEIKSGLAGAGASCLVTLFNLSVSISDESLDLGLDLCYKLFHFYKNLVNS